MNLVGFWLGGLLGSFFLDFDHLVYALIINPQTPTNFKIKQLFGRRRFKEAVSLLTETTRERFRLPFHNSLFQLVFYVFCFFVLTSTGSLFGAGLVMAMALHLLKDEVQLLLAGQEEWLRQLLFWPVKVKVDLQQQKLFVILMLLIFLGLNVLLV